MKLFGKDLFNHAKPAHLELYDFAQHGLLRSVEHIGIDDIDLGAISGDDETADNYLRDVKENNEKAATRAKKKKEPLTPKQVYELEALNDKKYSINIDERYIQRNVNSLRQKMSLLPQKKPVKQTIGGIELTQSSYGASKFGYEEMGSLIERLENRRFYKENEGFFNQYPYTRSELINDVLSAHQNLRSKRVEEFIPDMPDEAIRAMVEYNKVVNKICGKNAVFYIIADKKDFGEVDKKRDPILLAQSPFALAWNIVGAWDDTMVYLGDL